MGSKRVIATKLSFYQSSSTKAILHVISHKSQLRYRSLVFGQAHNATLVRPHIIFNSQYSIMYIQPLPILFQPCTSLTLFLQPRTCLTASSTLGKMDFSATITPLFSLRVRPTPKLRALPSLSVTVPPASVTRMFPLAWSQIFSW